MKYPHAYRWYIHIAALQGVRGVATPVAVSPPAPTPAAPAPAKKEVKKEEED